MLATKADVIAAVRALPVEDQQDVINRLAVDLVADLLRFGNMTRIAEFCVKWGNSGGGWPTKLTWNELLRQAREQIGA